MTEKKRLTWFILIRLVVVSIFLVTTIFLIINEPESFSPKALTVLSALIIATYLFSIASLLLLRFREQYNRFLTNLQVLWDIIFVSILIVITGGIGSPFSFLYLLSIINASFLLARRQAIYAASLCGILYGSIIDLQYFGKLVNLGLSPLPAQQFGAQHLFYSIFVNIVAFYVTAILTGYLAERAHRIESALLEKVIDFEEMERQNVLIVSNINSGLITVNNEGRIRVFNRFAEQLTSVSQRDAYDRELVDVMPGFSLYKESLFSVSRGEIEFFTLDDNRLVLGFGSAPLTDKHGERIGAIINFQDLTKLKHLEADLKRADRLAAIGELSARIAHEIRNPLAAISGSVQLIAQGESVPEQDRKLFDIVLRETDRLNGLISDFLAYARPTSPQKMPVGIFQMVNDLEALLVSDPRFANIDVINECPRSLVVDVDHDQFKQVLWNLLVNAAEAIPAAGFVKIGARIVSSDQAVFGRQARTVEIEVSDNGAGIDKDQMKRIFEPFFTTKSGGSGLGLATVYRIIETHGGRISLQSEKGAGTTFLISLPYHDFKNKEQ